MILLVQVVVSGWGPRSVQPLPDISIDNDMENAQEERSWFFSPSFANKIPLKISLIIIQDLKKSLHQVLAHLHVNSLILNCIQLWLASCDFAGKLQGTTLRLQWSIAITMSLTLMSLCSSPLTIVSFYFVLQYYRSASLTTSCPNLRGTWK